MEEHTLIPIKAELEHCMFAIKDVSGILDKLIWNSFESRWDTAAIFVLELL